MNKINSILRDVILKIKPSKEEFEEMNKLIDDFVNRIDKKIKELKIDAEIFIGGSFAKKTVIKKDNYDVDVYLRFSREYNDEVSEFTKNILIGMENVSLIHGSRDYFRIKLREDFIIELIPVIKVKKPEESLNITDLSYSHVKYINKKIKSEKIKDEIMITKAFCYANHCYGAESYIKGFSGYAIELLVFYYGGFLKFIKSISKANNEKIIIDIEKQFKNKKQVMMDLNSSKLQSPIILIDPTDKNRNALAALSDETFNKFRKIAGDFLKNPSLEAFEKKKTDLEKIKKYARDKKYGFILLEAITAKQEGDIAGSKLLKFYEHLSKEIEKSFEIKDKGFNYNEKTAARYFFVVRNLGEIVVGGPEIKDKKNVEAFKKKHKDYFTKKGKIYSKRIFNLSIKEFAKKWIEKNLKKIKEMSVVELRILD